jgi:hypothetical protein
MHEALAADSDVVLLEAMGHVAMGSCLGLSAAHIAEKINAQSLLISGGGIGRAIDEISLCRTFVAASGARFMGVIVNKVWPEKYERVRSATAAGLKAMGVATFGAVPYEASLASPTMQQVYHLLGGEILSGAQRLRPLIFKLEDIRGGPRLGRQPPADNQHQQESQ